MNSVKACLFNRYLPCTYFEQDTVIGAVQVLVNSCSFFILFGEIAD